ncbi:MAG: hypothetical protein Q9174_000346 [Haloplaca sp. 1 TL-2023]
MPNRSHITSATRNHDYVGSGTEDDPYVVEFLREDSGNPMTFTKVKKWTITILVAFVTLAVAFVSSAFSGGIAKIVDEFSVSLEVATLGIAFYVVGFAIGPLLWAPMSEMYGRQIILFGTYAGLTVFNAGAAGAQNIETLLILRFFAGAFGSSALTNSGGVIADLFPASERGLALSLFAAAPFTGPTLGPIVGGFVGETIGWRWLEGILAMFTGFLWIVGAVAVPETYGPVLLRKRAARLSKVTGNVYQSKLEVGKPKPSLLESFRVALSRPWILLFREPIVLLLTIYMAIIYGTLYMLFSAFPIVYQDNRGWSQGVGSLPFLSILIGMFAAIIYTIPDNKRYLCAEEVARSNGASSTPPEARLPPCMVGSVCLPIGLFVFAWTNYSQIHWIVSVMFTAPFGFGLVLVFVSVMTYLIDAYTIYAASVLAANGILRSLFGAVFPLFTNVMYEGLGIHWASSIPAFLALACVPFPFLFYKYGAGIRMKCKYARSAAEIMAQMQKTDEPKRQEKEGDPPGQGIKADSDTSEQHSGEGTAPVRDKVECDRDVEKG